jgi:hypothetical protein
VKKINYKKIITSGVILLLLLNIAFMLGHIFILYQDNFNSDSAAKVLLAKEIFDTGRFFPSDWNYGNYDLVVVNPHVFIIPLLSFMPAGFAAHSISASVFAGFILFGVWLVTGIGKIPYWHRLAAVGVMASGISDWLVESLYGQVSYGVVFFFCLYIVYFSDRVLSSQGNKRVYWAILLITILVLAYWSNAMRAFVNYGLPLFLALSWMAFINIKKKSNKYFILMLIALLGAVLGSLLHIQTIKEVNNHLGQANARWLPLEGIPTNIGFTIKGLFAQLGGLLPANASLFTVVGLYAGFRFMVAASTLIVVPIVLKKTLAHGTDRIKLFALFSIFVLTLLMFMQITTTIPDMSSPVSSSRYMVPGILLVILLIIMHPIQRGGWSHQPSLLSMSVVLITITFITSGYHAYRLSIINFKHLEQPLQIGPDSETINFLRKNDLEYGYASYWNANKLTVLSDGEVKIRGINMNNGIPMPFRWGSSNRWYQQSAWQGKSFLLLHQNEIQHLNENKLERLGLIPLEKLQNGNFTVYVFAQNLSLNLPGWDIHYEKPAVFLVNADTSSQTGRLVDAEGIKMLVAEKGETGALHFGPYVHVEPGRYRVTFDVIALYHQAGTVRLDVVASHGKKIFGETTLTESSGLQVMEFSLDKLRTMEFRVWALGNEKVIFRSVTIQRLQKY